MSNDLSAVFKPSSFVGPYIVAQDGFVMRGGDVSAFGLEPIDQPFGLWDKSPAHNRPPTSGPVALMVHTASRLTASFKTYDDPADAAPDLIALGLFVAAWTGRNQRDSFKEAVHKLLYEASEEDEEDRPCDAEA